MTHDEAVERFSAYFAGTLSRDEVRGFHAHLSDCEDCKLRVRTMHAMAPRAGFTRLDEAGSEEKLKQVLAKNRAMTFIVVAVLMGFLALFRIFFRRP